MIRDRDAKLWAWASLALGRLLFQDDEFFSVSPLTGAGEPLPNFNDLYGYFDNWGPTTTDGTNLFLS